MVFNVFRRFAFVLLLFSGSAAAQEMPKKVYVPNPTGDVGDKVGSVIASEISAALMKQGIQAFTFANLSEQLKQEEYKEVLQCDKDSRCVDELVAGFGVATRIFTQVTKLGDKSYHLELSLETKGKFKNKEIRKAKMAEDRLGAVAGAMALALLGFESEGGAFTEETIGVQGGEWIPTGSTQFVVDFQSTPPGAVVMVDGQLLCQDTAKGCSRMLKGGSHRVTMQKEKYVKRIESVDIKKDVTIKWDLDPDFGWLTVTSTPPGLPVEINRKMIGTTPMTALEMAPGKYEVMVKSPCHHEQGKKLAIDRGEKEIVATRPVPKEGAIRVAAVDDKGNAVRADVYVDGIKVGTAPGLHKVSICAKKVEVRKGGAVWKKALSPVEKQVSDLKAVLEGTSVARAAEASSDVVLIPAGKFWMGCNEAVDSECDDDEKPYHDVYLDAFSMDRHEVTVAAYGKCVESGKCSKAETGGYCNTGKSGRTDHPINCVDWAQAAAYCKWAGKRLPTEAEWEKAARGTDGRKYPWGNQNAACSRAVMDDGGDGCGKDRTWPVCSKEAGNSPYGLCDMAGNVYEWVSDWYGKDSYGSSGDRNPGGPSSGARRVLRGGSWDSESWSLRASNRVRFTPVSRYVNSGFRCVVSPE